MTRPKYLLGLIFCLWATLILFCRCANQTGTDTGNPTTVSIKIVGIQESSSPKILTSFQTTGASITEARAVLKEINLEPLLGCLINEPPGPELPEMEFEFIGPFVINLLDNTSIPHIGTVQIPAGLYCELELKFDKLEAVNVPDGIAPDDPIVGNAFLIQGTRQDGTPFIVRLSEDDRFKLEGTRPNGFAINGNGESQFFVSFNLDIWFQGVDLNQAVVSDNGTILIDDQNNVALKALIIENVIQSSRLFRDLNGNGVLDGNESDESLVLGIGVDEEEI